jgi:hypothetical protein
VGQQEEVMRNVKYLFTEHQLRSFYTATSESEVWRAISYLSTWAFDGYDTVEIFVFEDGDMGANYRDSETLNKYYHIRAVIKDRHYGFHS